ncbi:hypothetical protein AAES_153504 [Amazona aestiva]|uniref:Uncharacterized protein n=1 Tax=Amazona aestiva TaxID=12930 RepID=A0A0Q3LWR7_AMAAE|nr:hypothetical protein AAES_153504 [Amazona aestiva]
METVECCKCLKTKEVAAYKLLVEISWDLMAETSFKTTANDFTSAQVTAQQPPPPPPPALLGVKAENGIGLITDLFFVLLVGDGLGEVLFLTLYNLKNSRNDCSIQTFKIQVKLPMETGDSLYNE